MHGEAVNCPKCNSVMDEYADMHSHQKVPVGGRGRVHNILVCPSCGHEQLSDKVIFLNNMPLDEMIANDAADGDFGLGPLYNSNDLQGNIYDDSIDDYAPDDIYLDDYDSDHYYPDTYSESGGFDFFLLLMYLAPMLIFIIILALFV